MYFLKSDKTNENYIRQILSSNYEGDFLLAAYAFEEDEEKLEELIVKKKHHIFGIIKSQN